MCIRDRFIGFDVARELLVDAGAADLDRDGATLGGDRAVNPVSYTHLRAHETVLDLVCRLLLEKKKRQEEYAE